MYEAYLAGQRVVMLCRADLIEAMNVPTMKTIYPTRFRSTEGFVEYGIDGIGIGSK